LARGNYFKGLGTGRMNSYLTMAQLHALERGAEACRDGKSRNENPYPPQADYYGLWEEGYLKQQDNSGK